MTVNLSEPVRLQPESEWYDRPTRWIVPRLSPVLARAAIRAHRMLARDRAVLIELHGFSLVVSPQDNCGHRLFYYESYEPLQVALWQRLLDQIASDSVVVDKGANMGFYTLIAASSGSVSKVLSFEPNPSVLPFLNTSVALNSHLSRKIEVVEQAVGADDGSCTFYTNIEAHNYGLGALTPRPGVQVSIEVPLLRLDSYIQPQEIEPPALVKSDVEGAEHRVVRGMEGILRSHNPPLIVMEVHPQSLQDLESCPEEVFVLSDRLAGV